MYDMMYHDGYCWRWMGLAASHRQAQDWLDQHADMLDGKIVSIEKVS